VPPNIYFGHLPLQLIGPGAHKIYWLDADHIDDTKHVEKNGILFRYLLARREIRISKMERGLHMIYWDELVRKMEQ